MNCSWKSSEDFFKSYFCCLVLLLLHFLQPAHSKATCGFPPAWWGNWFQQGFSTPILVNSSHISSQGECVESLGEKFIVRDTTRDRGCFRCLAIHQKHKNVIQYKESYCDEYYTDAEVLCREITGDAHLYSMFRRDEASPVSCPFHGPLAFSYDKGHGECKDPASSVESCTDRSKLLFRFQACSDVKSEASNEELECLATWREGSLEYLMGRLKKSGSSFREDEDEFRCFVYEKGHGARSRGADILLAQSGDASCNGIYSAAEGPLVMKLSHKVKTKHQCHFPPWAVAHHKWHSLDWETVYQFTHGNSSVRITEKQYSGSRPPERLTCHAQWDRLTGTSSVDNNGGYVSTAFVVHALRECYGRYLCMVLHRRGANIMEVQFGESSMEEDMACTSLYFNKETAPYITLMVMNPSEIQCPTLGQWNIARDRSPFEVPGNSMACQSPRTLLVGCGGSSGVGLELQDKCASSKVSVTDTRTIRELAIPDAGSYTCHAYWEVNDTLFIVTSDENKPRDMTCFTLRTSSHASFSVLAMRHRESRQRRRGVGDSFFVDQPTVMLLAASERGCYRSTSSPEVVSFNATMMAYCGEHQSLTSSSAASSASLLSASLAVAFPVLLIQLLASCCRR